MATGHMNPGYDRVVTRFSSALENPTGERRSFRANQHELDDIRKNARDVWSIKDTSETTYKHFFADPLIKKRTHLRPSSPTRRNNPHPSNVFLTTRLRTLPGCYNNEDKVLSDDYSSYNKDSETSNYSSSFRSRSAKPYVKEPTVSVFENAKHYLQTLSAPEAVKEDENLKKVGVDASKIADRDYANLSFQSKSAFFQPTSKGAENEEKSNCETDCKRRVQLQSNMLNPYLYDDYRQYREKYASNNHGMPNPNAKKPFRGDFLIHYDWPPQIKHHRLPYMY